MDDRGGNIGVSTQSGVTHLVRCGGSILHRLNLGPPLLTVLLMLPIKRVVHAVEKAVLLLMHLVRHALERTGSPADSAAGGVHPEMTAEALLRKKTRIMGSIGRNSMAVPLVAAESGSEDDDDEAAAAVFVSRLSLRHQLGSPRRPRTPRIVGMDH